MNCAVIGSNSPPIVLHVCYANCIWRLKCARYPPSPSQVNVECAYALFVQYRESSFDIAQIGKGGETEGEIEFHAGLLPCYLPGKCVLVVFFVCFFI